MQALGEAPQDRLLRIGGDAFDDELVPGHAQRDALAAFKQPFGTAHDGSRRRLKRRMSGRIHRVLVQGDRQIDEELAELARQRGPFRTGCGVAHTLGA